MKLSESTDYRPKKGWQNFGSDPNIS